MCNENIWWETFPDFSDAYSENWQNKYWDYVDSILSSVWIELEKCSWKKIKIWNVEWNDLFVYEISNKYIKDNMADIYIHIWWKRNNNYRINFQFNIWEMKTWDYTEIHQNRIEKSIVFYDSILIQDTKTKLWKNMWKKTKNFEKELDRIIMLIKRDYLNTQINKQ